MLHKDGAPDRIEVMDSSVGKVNQFLLNMLREDFNSPDPVVRKKAIYTFGRLGKGPEVIAKLHDIAVNDESPEVRYTAKKALNYWSELLEEQQQPVADVLIDDADGQVDMERFREILGSGESTEQLVAILEVVQRGEEVALAAIEDFINQEDDPWVLSMMVKAVGALGQRQHVTVLQPFLHHKNKRVVANCIEALDMLGDELVVSLVKPQLKSEDNRVRANAIKAIHRYSPELAIENLRDMAQSKKEWMRDSAVYCLKILDDEGCEAILIEMLEEEPSAELVTRIVDVLTLKGGPQTVGALNVLAENARGKIKELYENLVTSLCTRQDIDRDKLVGLSNAYKAMRRGTDPGVTGGMVTARPRAKRGPIVRALPESTEKSEGVLPKVVSQLTWYVPLAIGLFLIMYFTFSLISGWLNPPDTSHTLTILRRYDQSPDPARFHGKPAMLTGCVASVPSRKHLRMTHGEFILDVKFSSEQSGLVTLEKGSWVTVKGAIKGRGITGDIFVNGNSFKVTSRPAPADDDPDIIDVPTEPARPTAVPQAVTPTIPSVTTAPTLTTPSTPTAAPATPTAAQATPTAAPATPTAAPTPSPSTTAPPTATATQTTAPTPATTPPATPDSTPTPSAQPATPATTGSSTPTLPTTASVTKVPDTTSQVFPDASTLPTPAPPPPTIAIPRSEKTTNDLQTPSLEPTSATSATTGS